MGTGRILLGGAAGIVAKDLILQGAVAAGWARYDLWAILARPLLGGEMVPFTISWSVAATGFLLHLAIGMVWAGLVELARPWWLPLLARSRGAAWLALVNTAVIWTGWGLGFPALGLGPAPWALGPLTTAITLASDLAYSLVLAVTLTVAGVALPAGPAQ
ncbi:MAG: hypothetical protein H5U04_12875 [Firmicutes bacterium]|nr:hypothetical protein [Bacillota bacterium]